MCQESFSDHTMCTKDLFTAVNNPVCLDHDSIVVVFCGIRKKEMGSVVLERSPLCDFRQLQHPAAPWWTCLHVHEQAWGLTKTETRCVLSHLYFKLWEVKELQDVWWQLKLLLPTTQTKARSVGWWWWRLSFSSDWTTSDLFLMKHIRITQ